MSGRFSLSVYLGTIALLTAVLDRGLTGYQRMLMGWDGWPLAVIGLMSQLSQQVSWPSHW